MSKKYNKIRCGNCGKVGHVYKNCVMPVMSMGIICCQYKDLNINEHIRDGPKLKTELTDKHLSKNIDETLKYLLICRKHSMSYVEFIRGKYDTSKPEYIKKLMERMTYHELMSINKSEYEQIYKELWKNNVGSSQHHLEYLNAKEKFNILKHKTSPSLPSLLSKLINSIEKAWKDPEWGFPKGRRNSNETDFRCATREFNEETNLTKKQYNVIDLDPMIETYTSVNKVRYKHIYYLAQASDSAPTKLETSSDNKFQAVEISQLGWYTLEEASNLFRDYQKEKLKVLETVHKTLKSIIVSSTIKM